MTLEEIKGERNRIHGELKKAYSLKGKIEKMKDRRQKLDDAIAAIEALGELDEEAPTIEGTAPEPSTDDMDFVAPVETITIEEAAERFPDSDHPADAAVEEIKALDDEPTGDMTTPPAPNGGMTGWSY